MTSKFSMGAPKRLISAGLGTLVLFGSELAMAGPFDAPRDVSEHGHRIDWLINITNAFSLILFLIMIGVMVWSFIKFGKSHEAEYEHGTHKKHVTTALAISGIIFLIVDGNLWVNSTKDVNGLFWNFKMVDQDPKALKLEINARQWFWQARWAGKDGKFNTQDDALSDQDIRVPVNTPVLLQLSSPDVIHTFALPNFRIKQDAMPGMVNMMWFQGKEIGTFPIICVQHCGANHYKMKATLHVLSQEDYDKWLASKVRDSEAIWDDQDTEAHWGWDWKKVN
jgi:cytochrome c oxidase subunit II